MKLITARSCSCLALLLVLVRIDAQTVDEDIEENSLNRSLDQTVENKRSGNTGLVEPSGSGGGDALEQENEVHLQNPEADIETTEQSGSSSYVIRILSKAFRFLNLKRMVKNVQQGRSTPGACITCKFVMTMVRYLIDYGKGFKDVAYVTSYLCKTLNVQTARVCEGYVNSFMVSIVLLSKSTD